MEEKIVGMNEGVSYKILGLSNTREMFQKAFAGKYAVPAYNFNNMEQLQAIITACAQTASPVILQVSCGARNYADQTLLRYMAQGAVALARKMGSPIPIALHLDHGDSFELAQSCIDSGFSSVMIDGSHLPFEENIALAKQVVEYAHPRDVSVEAELGVLAGIEDEVSHAQSHYTNPDDVEEFARRTGVDSLAISIGTSHGAFKFKPQDCTLNADGVLVPPSLRFDILEAIEKRIPGFPIVAAWRILGCSQVCRYDQSIRRQAGSGDRYSRRAASPRRRKRRVQDQHRQRRPTGDDGGDPQSLC